MAKHRRKYRRHYGDGPSSGGISFWGGVGLVVVGTVAAQWVMAFLPVTPSALLPPAGSMSGLRR